MDIPRTKADWAQLTQVEKEAAWRAKFHVSIDSRFPEKISTPEMAMRTFAAYLMVQPYRDRNTPRRGYLAALKGGRCEIDRLIARRPELSSLPPCSNTVDDYRFLRMWEFNHIVPRAFEDKTQFVISGSSLWRRAWDVVKEHALRDTTLLCRECHNTVTELEKEAQIIANRIVYGYAH